MKNLNGYLRGIFLATGLLSFAQYAPCQSAAESPVKSDRDMMKEIAPYSADVRTAILEVAQYPQALVQLERIQARSSQSFQDLISGYSRQEQEKFYEISRFPDLLNQLAGEGNKSSNEVKSLLKDLPEATQNSFEEIYGNHYKDLQRMNSMYKTSQDGLQKIISDYPKDIQDDFQKVVSRPDVMNLLTDNIDLTVNLGEDYKANPGEVTGELDRLNSELAVQNANDLDAYKKEVESDPNLAGEMNNAARDFSASYDQPYNPAYVSNNYYANYPYPYWFSYPYWYPAPIWYPRPFYYHTGFYYGPGGRIVVWGLPSRIYSNWFFGYGYRRYPMLYRHYGTYYGYGHRNDYGYRGRDYGSRNHYSTRYGSRYSSRPDNSRNWSTGRTLNNAPTYRNTYRGTMNSSINRPTRMAQPNFQAGHLNNRGMNHYRATPSHSTGTMHFGGSGSGGGSRGGSGGHIGGGSHGGGGGHGGHGGGGGGRRGR